MLFPANSTLYRTYVDAMALKSDSESSAVDIEAIQRGRFGSGKYRRANRKRQCARSVQQKFRPLFAGGKLPHDKGCSDPFENVFSVYAEYRFVLVFDNRKIATEQLDVDQAMITLFQSAEADGRAKIGAEVFDIQQGQHPD